MMAGGEDLDQDDPEWIAWLIESRVGMVQGVE